MPNWWNKIQQAAGIPNNSPFTIQLNSQGIPIPSINTPHQTTFHSYPSQQQHQDEAMEHEVQPTATITVLNEQPDLLPQSAKDAQELLAEIQRQLQKLNHPETMDSTKSKDEATKHIDSPTTHSNNSQSDSKLKTQTDAPTTTTTTQSPPTTSTKHMPETTTPPMAKIVSADKESKSSSNSDEAEPRRRKNFDEAPARKPQKMYSQESEEAEFHRRPTSTIGRKHRFDATNQENNLAKSEFNQYLDLKKR